MQGLGLMKTAETSEQRSGLVAMEAKRGRGRPVGSRNRPHPMEEPELTCADVERMTAIEQARQAFRRGNLLAAGVGLILGGFVPLASYTIIHVEVATRPYLWILVAGGLAYSAPKVYAWALQAFHAGALTALGFVVLLEGTMTLSGIRWLGLAGLTILMAVNGVSAAVNLQVTNEE